MKTPQGVTCPSVFLCPTRAEASVKAEVEVLVLAKTCSVSPSQATSDSNKKPSLSCSSELQVAAGEGCVQTRLLSRLPALRNHESAAPTRRRGCSRSLTAAGAKGAEHILNRGKRSSRDPSAVPPGSQVLQLGGATTRS